MFFYLVFWIYTIAVIHPYLPIKSFYLYMFLNILIGVIAPIFLCIGITLILLAAQKITNYEFQAESVVPGILTFVSFKIGQEYCFWVIAKFYYFPVDKDDVNDPGQKLSWMQRNLKLSESSSCITILLILNSILPIMFLANKLILQEHRTEQCSDVTDNYDCFEHATRGYINCSNDTYYIGELDCYQFIKIKDANMLDPLGSLIKAIFLFIATEKFLLILFSLVKAMFNFRRSKVWIIMIVIIGLIMTTVSIMSIVLYYVRHNSGFLFLSVLQFTILSLAVLFAGLLLLSGSPMELISKGGNRGITLKPMFANKIDDSNIIKDKLVT